jgi:DNA-binding IclR family transcriptional regulator
MQEPMYLEDGILARLQRGAATAKYLAKTFNAPKPVMQAVLGGLQERKLVQKDGIHWHLTRTVYRGDAWLRSSNGFSFWA